MQNSFSIRMLAIVAAGISIVLSPGQAISATDIGKTESVVGAVQGLLDGAKRQISRNDAVFSDETLSTGKASTSHVIFKDDTFLQIGPDAELTLDSLVYDPSDAMMQEMVLNLTKGTFRFISGKMEKTAYKINVPGGHIGIRGTVVLIDMKPDDRLLIAVEEGSIVLTLDDGSTIIEVPEGAALRISLTGGGPPVELGLGAPEVAEMIAQMSASNLMGEWRPFNYRVVWSGWGNESGDLSDKIDKSQSVYEEGCE